MARPNCPRCGKEFQPELYWWHCQGCGYVVTKNAHTRAYGKLSKSKRERELEAALREMVYEATHLSPEQEDGSHKCRISKGALEKARAALAGSAAQTAGTSENISGNT